jgi:hypothetical protein
MTIALYPNVVYENNLAPDHGGSEVDEACEEIHAATKGWGVRICLVASTTYYDVVMTDSIVNGPCCFPHFVL